MNRTILAKTKPGTEFLYSAKSAHRVNKAKADKIADLLNRARYKLQDGEIWYRLTFRIMTLHIIMRNFSNSL